MSVELMEKVKQQWLAAKYVDIVEGIVTGSRIRVESVETETERVVSCGGSVRPREPGVTIEVAEDFFRRKGRFLVEEMRHRRRFTRGRRVK